jgi:hypothetical protein
MGDEDKRSAVGISVNLSTQLIAAALALLAVEGAYVAYALGDREVQNGFILMHVASVILLVASIFIAGKGITKARDAGYSGFWDLSVGKQNFNWQAICCLLALLSFGIGLLLSGPSKENEMKDEIIQLQSRLLSIQERESTLGEGHNSQEKSIAEIREELARMMQSVKTSSGKERPH